MSYINDLAQLVKLTAETTFKRKRKESTKLAILDELIDDNDLHSLEATTALLQAVTEALDPVTFSSDKLRKAVKQSGNFIISGIQNNTETNGPALKALQRKAEILNAELILLPVYYNKKAFSQAVEEGANFSAKVIETDLILNNKFYVYTNSHVLPTAKAPVNAAADLNEGERYSVIASPKMQRKELPRTVGQPNRTALTTGVLTEPNYLKSRAGTVAERDHKIAALFISESGTIEQLEYDENLQWDFEPVAFVLGDVHAENLDPIAWEASVNYILQSPSINTVVLHDLLDMENRNGHARHDWLHLYQQKDRSIQDDLDCVISLLTELSDLTQIKHIKVVRSNHDDMLDRLLGDTSYQSHLDPVNAKLYFKLKLQQLENIDNIGHCVPALQMSIENVISDKVEFLTLDTSEQLAGVEISQHGHKGTNGARSGLQNCRFKMVTGHTHTAGLIGDHVVVGTVSRLSHGYNAGGGTTWTQTNCAICSSGRLLLVDC